MQTNPNDPNPSKHWRDWLASEQDGREDLAEFTFARLMADLPPVEPSPAFVGRTVQAAWQRRVRQQRLAWVARAAAVLAVLIGGGVGLFVLGTAFLGAAADGVVAGVQGLIWTADAVGGGLRWWSLLEKVGTAVGTAVATPQTTAVLVALELMGAMAVYGIERLLGDEAAQEEAQV
ncbi:MAG: hypothetical protein ABL971_11740 [Vicinamibacterales bacterium]